MQSLYSNDRVFWQKYFVERGFSEIHLKKFLKKYYSADFCGSQIDDLEQFPRSLLSNIKAGFSVAPSLTLSSYRISSDHSVKMIFSTVDGHEIETVLMPEVSRTSLCLSSQIGCKRGCSFCFTGRMGLIRSLRSEEIIDQYRLASQWIWEHADWQTNLSKNGVKQIRKIDNIVFMGMGEPLDNVENLIQSIEILIDPFGFSVPKSKISVSTAGHLDGIKVLFNHFSNLPLALSLHGASDSLRNKIMPINKIWPLLDVIEELKALQNSGRLKKLLIQYTLISGVNDHDDEICNLVNLLQDLKCKVNLIPLNPVAFSKWTAPSIEKTRRIQELLLKGGIRTMVRFSKAQDIQGACGQLNK